MLIGFLIAMNVVFLMTILNLRKRDRVRLEEINRLRGILEPEPPYIYEFRTWLAGVLGVCLVLLVLLVLIDSFI